MQKLNRLTLALIVGLGAGISSQAQNAGTAASATQVTTGATANQDVLMEALRKKQAELSAAGIAPDANPAKASALEKKALAKKQKAEQEALAAQKNARSAEAIAEKIRAGEASKKGLAAPKEVKPAAAESTKISEPQSLDQLSISVNAPSVATKEQMDQMMQALRNKQSELAAQEAAAKQTKGDAKAAPEKVVKEVIVIPAQAPATKEQVDQMMQALRNKQAELAAQEAAAKAQAKESAKPAPEKVVKANAVVPAAEARKELTKQEKLELKKKAAMEKAVAREQKRKAKMAAEAKKAVQQAPVKPEIKEAIAEKAKTPAKPTVVPANAVKPAQVVTEAPKKAPAPVLSKEQRLADLLRRYKADQLTPREYQAERAKVIAEP